MTKISHFPPMQDSGHSPRRIAVIGYDGVQALDIVGPMEVFAIANFHLPEGMLPYEVLLASPAGGAVKSSSAGGLVFGETVRLERLPADLDTIILAGGSEDGLRQVIFQTDLLAWLHSRAGPTRRMASVCTGAFILAAGGFLDGRRATTHWNSCALLKELRPQIEVEPDAIFVAEPPVFTSAGITAGIDLCMALIEADCGPKTALAVARQMVLFMRRPGGQSQFSAGLALQANATPRLRQLLSEIIVDPTGDLSGPALASRVGMTERTFSRSFRKETGTTPAQFVEAARLERAKALLESSDWPLARIAERAGFSSLDTLHRAFLKHLAITPGFYRARFGARVGA
ncbi:GlxA family transcriptional regulator [Rhizobium multihospitium]|uniref:Transcriptional regulator, AraC family with amidase-like domain n=1 Tax=Rhizobium multihospitium TaxID=410764 RepID=A0A1C3U9P8_9HYPH|nr:helix-turn-helix domain-containing protein [Rhizobium multihospitium]SCB12204.1 transcriptional regulator, AraC family with amidase-like domain [Rhizobium multihospitium]